MPQFNPENLNIVPLDQAVAAIQNGWVAQFRGWKWHSQVIKYATGGPHSHSAMLRVLRPGKVEILEVVEGAGGRAVPLEASVRRSPERIDVFSISPWLVFDHDGAVGYMEELIKRDYGYLGILRLAMQRIPLLWRLWPLSVDDARDSGDAPFCSHAVCSACRIGGGVDPVPRLPDDRVTPNHLTWSMLFDYEFTIGAQLCQIVKPEPCASLGWSC